MKVKLSLLIPRITWEWQYHLWPSPGWRYCTAKVSPHKRCPDGTGCKVLGIPLFRDSPDAPQLLALTLTLLVHFQHVTHCLTLTRGLTAVMATPKLDAREIWREQPVQSEEKV